MTTVSAVSEQLEERRQARHHEDAGRHHGRGVDEGGDRRRALHGVGQPGVQEKLRRLAHRPHEEEEADDGQRVEIPRQEMHLLADDGRRIGEDRLELDRVEQDEDREDAEREAEVADAVDDERLDRGGVGGGPLVPEADEQIGGEANALPAEEELDEVVGRHQRQHGEGEERQVGEEPRPVRVVRHVADRVDVDERRHRRDHDQHHHGQRIDAERPVDRQRARTEPVEDLDALGGILAEADREEGDPGQDRRDDQEPGGDDLGGARTRRPRARACSCPCASPSSCSSSASWAWSGSGTRAARDATAPRPPPRCAARRR